MDDLRQDSAQTGVIPASQQAAHHTATAALGLGVLLWLVTAADVSSEVPLFECEYPREVASLRGWTTDVGCGDPGSGGTYLRGPVRLLFGLTLDLNRADAEALEVLPRIGPRRATAIVHARQEAEFSSVADLARVRGIGTKTIEGLSGWVGVGVGVGGPKHE